MKVLISADIEGTALTTHWEECYPQTKPASSSAAGLQMTREVAAACEGAIAAGATELVVKDAHSKGTNLDPNLLPACARIVRGNSGSPWSMVFGVDKSFDAAMFVGYHSAAGRGGNPLSHTETTDTVWVKLNGVKCSEFRLYSWACASIGVPTVFLAGDQMLIDDSRELHPLLRTVAVKEGFGGATVCLQPQEACRRIRREAEQALRQDLTKALCTLPEAFTLEVCYKEVKQAAKLAFFPGFTQVDDNTIRMHTRDYWEVLRAAMFVL